MEQLSKIKELIEELVTEKGYSLYSFNFYPKKGDARLEIVVDRDEDINIDDITNISNDISSLLDNHDFSEFPYVLDVSSLGIEKPIKIENLEKYIGKHINIHLSNPYKGKNIIEGDLINCSEDTVTITYKEKTRNITIKIVRKDIDKARLAIKF